GEVVRLERVRLQIKELGGGLAGDAVADVFPSLFADGVLGAGHGAFLSLRDVGMECEVTDPVFSVHEGGEVVGLDGGGGVGAGETADRGKEVHAVDECV